MSPSPPAALFISSARSSSAPSSSRPSALPDPARLRPTPEIDPAVGPGAVRRIAGIVELRVPPGGEPAAREVAIARAQDMVLARLPESHAAVARRYASIPMLALEIDRTALGALEAMADMVVSVKADGVVRPQ